MLTLPRSVRIYLAGGVTDLRKSIDSLSAVVTGKFSSSVVRTSLSCSVTGGGTESKCCTGTGQGSG